MTKENIKFPSGVPYQDLFDRYRRDPRFATIVDAMYHNILQFKIQPYEIQDAAFMAEVKFRELNAKEPWFLEGANN